MARICMVALGLLLYASAVRATSYPPVTFTDLVTSADVIFVGEVIDVRPFSVATRDGLVIKTRVVFRVTESLSGSSGATEVMDFLGGEVNGLGMAVAGMPAWTRGARHVVFAHREASINPIVGFTQGLLRLKRDAGGVDRVLTYEGLPLDRPESVTLGVRRASAGAPAMTLPQLRDRVRGALTVAGRR